MNQHDSSSELKAGELRKDGYEMTQTDGELLEGRPLLSRRKLLLAGCAALGTGIGAKAFWDYQERFLRARVFVAKVSSYEADLVRTLMVALRHLGLRESFFEGRSVLLKPNLVEPASEAPHINTHPAVTAAVAAVAQRWGAREVVVGEGPGHTRDLHLVLQHSGYGPMLHRSGIKFLDLNTDDVVPVENRLGFTSLKELYLPRSVVEADLVISLPKMKTHHWAGVTLSMKNLFGVMPGLCYGWPKNVLHFEGLTQSILDIAATVRPQLAVIDGIVAMEGDGPIMGSSRRAGLLIVGTNLAAVDATAARLMGFKPRDVDHINAASGIIGPIKDAHIEQRGESATSPAVPFRTLHV